MNMTTENDRKLAEALKPFSLDTVAQVSSTPRRARRMMSVLALLLAASAAVWMLAKSDIVPMMRSTLLPTSEPSVVADATAPDAAQNPSAAAAPAAVIVAPMPEISGSGYVTAPDTVAVFAKYAGRIAAVRVDLGDYVSAGDAVLSLEDTGASLALSEALIAQKTAELLLEARQIDAAAAKTSHARMQALFTKHAVSGQELDDAETARKISANSVALAEQALGNAGVTVRKAQEHVGELVVHAPVSGIVTALAAKAGASVLDRADTLREADSLMVITNTDTLVIDAEVAESNISKLRVGLAGEAVLDGFPDTPFAVSVARIAPVVSIEKGTVMIRLALHAPPQGIRPNMAARIRLTLAEPASPDIKN